MPFQNETVNTRHSRNARPSGMATILEELGHLALGLARAFQ